MERRYLIKYNGNKPKGEVEDKVEENWESRKKKFDKKNWGVMSFDGRKNEDRGKRMKAHVYGRGEKKERDQNKVE